MHKILFLLVLSTISISGCDAIFSTQEEKYIQAMQGEWTIENLYLASISPNGNVVVRANLNDAGTFVQHKGEICYGSGYCNDFEYNGPFSNNGYPISMPQKGALKVDETIKRVIFIETECATYIGCDRGWTIDKNSNGEQVWSYYKVYTNYTDKLTLTLKK